jgi:3-phenylpropionate/trans-cinnamate dioxygenase ferredoxin component
MAEFVTVGAAGEVDEGDVKAYAVGDKLVAVTRVDGTLYAFSDTCTHQGCSLSAGELDGTEIECECHGSVFDVTTGEVVSPPARDALAVYSVREQGNELQVAT